MKTVATKKRTLPIPFIVISLAPTVLLLLVFMVYPTIKAAILSFQDVGLLSASGKFIGFDNYAYLLTDEKFRMALLNTVKVIIAVPVGTIIISLLLSIFIHQSNIREKNFYITFYFFPYFMSATVVAIVWANIFYPTSNGPLNSLLRMAGLKAVPWLGSAKTALWCICAVIIWSCIGYHVVLYLSSLDSIPPELYESAMLDGASGWKQTLFITLPLMKNVIGITFVLLVSGALGCSYVYSMVMTNGGPGGATTVLLQYVYEQGLEQGNVGYSSAVTIVTMILSIALAVVSRKLTSNTETE